MVYLKGYAMLKFLFRRKPTEDRMESAVAHTHQREQQTVIRGRASKIIADQRAKSLNAPSLWPPNHSK